MIKFFTRLFKNKELQTENQEKEVKYLIVGLGNIGPDYNNTRHNVGFMIVDKLAEKKEVSFISVRYGDKTTFRFKGRTFILLKPSTYMNLSGKAIDYWLKKEKVDIENMLVIVDDVALPLGTIRIKTKGGDGGHNGLNNIMSILGTNIFSRLRFGIGDGYTKGSQVHFVLGQWTPEEIQVLKPRIDEAADAVVSFGTAGAARTMNMFNTKE